MKNKTKNNEKLARNTIRARKALKKRQNEQTTQTRRKRWQSRLFALVGCLLVLSSMVLPCFAVPAPDVTPDYYTAFIQSMPDYVRNNTAFVNLLDVYRRNAIPDVGSGGLFSNQFLYVLQQEDLHDYMNMGDSTNHYFYDANVSYRIDCEYLAVNFYDSTHTIDFYGRYSSNGSIGIFLSFDDETIRGSVMFDFPDVGEEIHFFILGVNYGPTQEMWYDSFMITNYAGDIIVENPIYDVNDFNIAFTVKDVPILGSDIEGLAMLNSLLHYGTVNYTTLYSPYQFYQGYHAGLSGELGYQDGYEEGYLVGGNEGYLQGRLEGLLEGKEQGFENGYEDGFTEGVKASEQESYDKGYYQAITDSGSGAFGRNLLGGSFSAVFSGLKEFTLVSWELQNGRTIEITILTLFSAIVGVSLFIWFLKLFAGG